jgi:Flp pilus assembly protein TadG
MIAPTVGLLLVGLIGVTAITIDGGLLMADRRHAQAAADAAALAGH